MCPSKYNRFWDRVRYLWKKIVILSYPLAFDAPVRGGFPWEYRHSLWDGKTRMASLPDGEKISKICLFVLTWSTNVTDGQTDGRTDRQTLHHSKDRAYASHRAVNMSCSGFIMCSLFASCIFIWINKDDDDDDMITWFDTIHARDWQSAVSRWQTITDRRSDTAWRHKQSSCIASCG